MTKREIVEVFAETWAGIDGRGSKFRDEMSVKDELADVIGDGIINKY